MILDFLEDRERRVFGHNRRIITAISVESSPPAGLGSRLRFRRSHGNASSEFRRNSGFAAREITWEKCIRELGLSAAQPRGRPVVTFRSWRVDETRLLRTRFVITVPRYLIYLLGKVHRS